MEHQPSSRSSAALWLNNGIEVPVESEAPAASPRAGEVCDCGRGAAVDTAFLARAGKYWAKVPKCRHCKVFLFLHYGFEVDKYCYNNAWPSRRRKYLGLSKDNLSVEFWPQYRGAEGQAHATQVPFAHIVGVVFGAYTVTFKRLRSSDMPPEWAAFSLVCRDRTYDFSARLPEAVECSITGFQELIWRSRLQDPQSTLDASPVAAPSKPWQTGFFLWMRLRFRLQEAAQKARLHPHHELWIVLVRCAFQSSDAHTKHRFLDMASKLQHIFNIDPKNLTADMHAIALTLNFQKERVQEIIEDRYECNTLSFLPQAPPAIAGRPVLRKHGSFSVQQVLTEYTPSATQ